MMHSKRSKRFASLMAGVAGFALSGAAGSAWAADGGDFVAPTWRGDANTVHAQWDVFAGSNPYNPDVAGGSTGSTLGAAGGVALTTTGGFNLYDPSGVPTFTVTVPGSALTGLNSLGGLEVVLQVQTEGTALDITSPTANGLGGVRSVLSSTPTTEDPFGASPLVGEGAISGHFAIGPMFNGIVGGFEADLATDAWNTFSNVGYVAGLTAALSSQGFTDLDFAANFTTDEVEFTSVTWSGFPSSIDQDLYTFLIPYPVGDLTLVFFPDGSSSSLQAVSVDVQAAAIPEPAAAGLLLITGAACWRRRRVTNASYSHTA